VRKQILILTERACAENAGRCFSCRQLLPTGWLASLGALESSTWVPEPGLKCFEVAVEKLFNSNFFTKN
jgi:hypothetical protein